MKITASEVEALKALIEPVDNEHVRNYYRSKQFERAELTKDVNRRYRFDLFYTVKGWNALNPDISYTDEHIYTALKTIVTDL